MIANSLPSVSFQIFVQVIAHSFPLVPGSLLILEQVIAVNVPAIPCKVWQLVTSDCQQFRSNTLAVHNVWYQWASTVFQQLIFSSDSLVLLYCSSKFQQFPPNSDSLLQGIANSNWAISFPTLKTWYKLIANSFPTSLPSFYSMEYVITQSFLAIPLAAYYWRL